MKITAQHREWLLGGVSLNALARAMAANAAARARVAHGEEGDAPAVRFNGVKWRPKFKLGAAR